MGLEWVSVWRGSEEACHVCVVDSVESTRVGSVCRVWDELYALCDGWDVYVVCYIACSLSWLGLAWLSYWLLLLLLLRRCVVLTLTELTTLSSLSCHCCARHWYCHLVSLFPFSRVCLSLDRSVLSLLYSFVLSLLSTAR